jgi:hypothetical protein
VLIFSITINTKFLELCLLARDLALCRSFGQAWLYLTTKSSFFLDVPAPALRTRFMLCFLLPTTSYERAMCARQPAVSMVSNIAIKHG